MTAPPVDINPRWRAWYAGLGSDKKDEVMAAWEAALSSPDIEESHRNSAYARKLILIDESLAFGYEK